MCQVAARLIDALLFSGGIPSMKFTYGSTLGLLFRAMLLLVLPLSACTAQTQTLTSLPQNAASSTLFDGYGIYESCSPKNAAMCLSHLNNMAAAGFKLVINYDELYGDASFQKAYLDRAQSVGMKVIVALNNPAFYNGTDLTSKFPALAQTCNCTDNHGFLQYVVNLVKNHPAVRGYYIGDEVDPSYHDTMKSGCHNEFCVMGLSIKA